MSIHGMQMQHEHVHRAWPASKADHSCWPPYNWPPEWRKAWTHTLIQPAAYQTPVPLPPLPSNGTHHNVHSNEMAADTYNAVCCSIDQTPTLQTCPMGIRDAVAAKATQQTNNSSFQTVINICTLHTAFYCITLGCRRYSFAVDCVRGT